MNKCRPSDYCVVRTGANNANSCWKMGENEKIELRWTEAMDKAHQKGIKQGVNELSKEMAVDISNELNFGGSSGPVLWKDVTAADTNQDTII
jgi:hypothetical protein